ncbi:MAG: hypothetical protein IJO93_00705 [Clostridia bacterium]|nr:hypothetical protein [Clostridia bacterium]
MKKSTTNILTFGAITAAFFTLIYSVFAVSDSSVQEIISLVCAMPLAVFCYMYGVRAALICSTACILLCGIFTQPFLFFVYALPCAVIAFALGLMARKTSLLPTLAVVSTLSLLHFVYEIILTSLFSKVNLFQEYIQIADKVGDFTLSISASPVLFSLVRDMTICGIPILFVLGAMAKSGIYYIALAVIIKHLFKENIIQIKLPVIYDKATLFTYIYIGIVLIFAVIFTLTLSGVIAYSLVIGIFADCVLVIMYLYMMYALRRISMKMQLPPVKRLPVLLLLILFFPVTNACFAVRTIFSQVKSR